MSISKDAVVIPDTGANPVVLASDATKEAENYLAFVQSSPIRDDEDLAGAGNELKRVKSEMKRIEEIRISLTKPLLDHKRNIDSMFNRPLELFAQVEKILKKKILVYQTEVEARRQEEERKRLEELKRLERKMEKAEDAGKDTSKIQTQIQEVAAAAPLTPAPAKVDGAYKIVNWDYQVVDMEAFVRFCLTQNELHLLEVNGPEVRKLVKALKEKTRIPGIVAVQKDTIGIRT